MYDGRLSYGTARQIITLDNGAKLDNGPLLHNGHRVYTVYLDLCRIGVVFRGAVLWVGVDCFNRTVIGSDQIAAMLNLAAINDIEVTR